MKRFRDKARLGLILLSLLQSACGGGSGGGAEHDAGIPADGSTASDEDPGFGFFKVSTLTNPDGDGDGIPDSEDPFPATASIFAEDIDNFHLEAVVAYNNQAEWPGVVHADLALRFRVTGLPAANGPFHAVFVGSDSIDVRPLEDRGEPEILELNASVGLMGDYSRVYVISATRRTEALSIEFLNAGEPLLIPNLSLQPGANTAAGINLNAVTEVRLEGQEQDANPLVTGGELSFNLLAEAVSGRLELVSASNPEPPDFFVQILRPVTVNIDRADGFFSGSLQWVSAFGVALTEVTTPSADIRSPSDRVGLHYFMPSVDEFDYPLPRGLAVWPDEGSKALSRATLLEALVVRDMSNLFPRLPDSWPEQKIWVTDLLTNPSYQSAVQAALDLIDSGINEGADPDFAPAERYTSFAVLSKLETAASAVANERAPVQAKLFMTPASPGSAPKKIYDIGVKTFLDYDSKIPRSEESNYRVGIADSFTCGVSPNRFLSGKRDSVRPFDLCIENDSKTIASVAVYVADSVLETGQLVFDLEKPIREHIQKTGSGPAAQARFVLHPDIVGGNTFGPANLANEVLLTGRDQQALCGMQGCLVEVLTSGWSVGTEDALTAEQALVAEALFQRTIVDKFVFPVLQEFGNGLLDAANKGCVTQLIVSNWLTLGLNSNDFLSKVANDNSVDNVLAALLDSYLKPILESVTISTLATCYSVNPEIALQIVERIASKLQRRFPILVVLSTIQKATTFTEILTTPRRFYFEVQPIAEVAVSSEIDVDLSDTVNPQELELGGSYMAVKDAPDGPADNYFPTIRLTDSASNSATLEVLVDDYFEFEDGNQCLRFTSSNSAGLGCIKFVPDLMEGIDELRPGRVFLQLEIDDYEPFDQNTPLVLPGGFLNLKTAPRIFGLENPTEPPRVGERSAMAGYRLDQLGVDGNAPNPPERRVILSPVGGGADVDAENVTVFRDTGGCLVQSSPCAASDSQTRVSFTVPDTLEVFQDYWIRFIVGNQTLMLPSPTVVLGENVFTAVVSDLGQAKDDVINMSYEDKNNDVIQGAMAPIERQIPFEGSYSAGIYIRPDIHPDVDHVRATCINPGRDGICTVHVAVTGQDPDGFNATVLGQGPQFEKETPPISLRKGESCIVDFVDGDTMLPNGCATLSGG